MSDTRVSPVPWRVKTLLTVPSSKEASLATSGTIILIIWANFSVLEFLLGLFHMPTCLAPHTFQGGNGVLVRIAYILSSTWWPVMARHRSTPQTNLKQKMTSPHRHLATSSDPFLAALVPWYWAIFSCFSPNLRVGVFTCCYYWWLQTA